MEAKDTVMSKERLQDIITTKFYGFDPDIDIDWEVVDLVKQAQAEISFKAGKEKAKEEMNIAQLWLEGKKAGKKEVVEFVGQNCYVWHDEENKAHVCLDKEAWQDKLKEWGIH